MASPTNTPKAPYDSEQNSVTFREKLGLSLGRLVSDGSGGTIHVLVNPVFNMTLGMNPALISMLMFIQRIWDAILDPLVGQFSDNFRSRWGRRRPLILVAALPLAVFFAAIWMVPRGLGDNGMFVHLLIWSLLFYVAHTFFSMPLNGLIIEATDDYHERSRLSGVIFAFAFTFQILIQWTFFLIQRPIFGDTITGLRWVAGGLGFLFVLGAITPALLCRERLYQRVVSKQERVPLLKSLRLVRDNRPFLILVSMRFVVSLGYFVVAIMAFYMNYYYVYGGDLKTGAYAYGFLGSSFHVAAVISTFVFPRLTRRWGKRRMMQLAVGVLMVGSLCKLVAYHPSMPWLQAIVLIANGISYSGLTVISLAMLGDVVDLDELNHGVRREALFASLYSWVEKAGSSLGTALSGLLLVWIGFDAAKGAQGTVTLELMKFFYFLTPFSAALLGFLILRRYDLDEDRANEIRALLFGRRKAENSDEVPLAPSGE